MTFLPLSSCTSTTRTISSEDNTDFVSSLEPYSEHLTSAEDEREWVKKQNAELSDDAYVVSNRYSDENDSDFESSSEQEYGNDTCLRIKLQNTRPYSSVSYDTSGDQADNEYSSSSGQYLPRVGQNKGAA
jgi:hypothetical protein